eukprot:m.180171 g.180171  ORF g.180171 m.180171 type:complete len:66 (+) comp18410_c0_seq2:2923-3120(+)
MESSSSTNVGSLAFRFEVVGTIGRFVSQISQTGANLDVFMNVHALHAHEVTSIFLIISDVVCTTS